MIRTCSVPIVNMFWMDEQLCSDLYLDGVVTMVDAKYCLQVCVLCSVSVCVGV